MRRVLLFLLPAFFFACKKDQDQAPATKDITSFVLQAADNAGVITADVSAAIENDTIRLALSGSTPLDHLVPVIQHKGVSISPQSGTAQNFSNPVQYTVTAGDGSRKSYTVVVEPLPGEKNVRLYFGVAGSVYSLNAQTGAIEWKCEVGLPIYPGSPGFSSPALYNGQLYIVGQNGYLGEKSYLYSINASTGDLSWKTVIPEGATGTSPFVEDGIVYVTNGTLAVVSGTHAFNANTGALMWTYRGYTFINTSPVVSGDLVYIGTIDYGIYAINKKTGAFVWRYNAGMVNGGVTVYNGDLYFVSDSATLTVLDAKTGALKRTYGSGVKSDGSVTIDNGTVYISNEMQLLAVDLATLTLKWKFESGGSGRFRSGEFSYPVVEGGIVYAGNYNGRVYALNAATGTLKWTSTDSTVEYEEAPQPTVSHGIVFSGSYMHDLSAYDAKSGGVKWVFKTPHHVYSGPCVLDVDNKVAYPGVSGHKN